jgi:hypothetical protein
MRSGFHQCLIKGPTVFGLLYLHTIEFLAAALVNNRYNLVNCDATFQGRIKQLFEKKNQKSAQTIAHQQRKLEEYRRKVSELQEHGLRPKSSHKLGQGRN